jgi:biotin carboxylase
MPTSTRPFAIYHEHPDWFRPLFAELQRRDIPFVRLDARRHTYNIAEGPEAYDYALVFNRMSPSAYLRGGGNSLFYTLNLLAHLERLGLRVINGSHAYAYETSKALQLEMLERLGLDYPRTRVINHASLAPVAAEGLRFPIVVKANVGGSGAGITRYDTPQALAEGVAEGSVELGIDGTALVQEFTPARDGHITRVETLGGKYLYAINVYTSGDSFNLCPADICRTSSGATLERNACPVDAPQNGMSVEAYTPPQAVIEAVERIAQAAQIDVGGIEYMVDDRDGRLVYYDVNALSNFVADARNVIGFDPHERLADFLVQEAKGQER